jgi:hypothetical protein
MVNLQLVNIYVYVHTLDQSVSTLFVHDKTKAFKKQTAYETLMNLPVQIV